MVAIENIEALKAWLAKKLAPICDADPKALAKYVVALVKKDKPENDLKTLCQEQLEVFLQKETNAFVQDMFETLQSKSYMKTTPEPSTAKADAKTSSQEQKDNTSKDSQKPHMPPSRSPVRRPRTPDMRRRIDDRRQPRRSPGRDSRRHYGRRPRSRTPSPRRQSRLSPSSSSRRRNQRSRSPRRSRSPARRKRSDSSERSRSTSRGRSSSPDSSARKTGTQDSESRRKERCWDYDEKGFCMKGDLCPYDHGTDALVVDNLSITTASTEENKTDGGKTEFKAVPVQAPTSVPPRPLMQGLPIGLPFPPPMIPTLSVPPPSLLPRFPPIPINVPPPPMQPTIGSAPSYNPDDPALHTGAANRTNEFNNFIANPGNFRKRPLGNGSLSEPGPKRSYYNNNAGSFNRTLIVKKIPAMLNNITKLNEHFAKFGAINNIQVKYNSLPNQALIEFAHVNSARAAIRSTEAVLNNRFIRVFWHNIEEAQQPTQPAESTAVSSATIKDRIGTLPPKADQEKEAEPENEEKSAAYNDGLISRTISNDTKPEEEQEDAEAVAAKAAVEKKAALEASNEAKKKILAAREAVKQKTLQKQKVILQKKVELHKQRQGLMQKQIEQQKLLLAKLEASKNMPASEKLELMKTLKALTSNIDAIRNMNKNFSQQKVNQEKQLQTQKDLLDTELDIYNASTNGENTMSLKRKLSQLKMEASSLGIVNAHRGGWGRGRGRGRGRRRGNSHRFIRAGANLDRRPCELRVSGFHETEKDEMISHFADFGEMETFSFSEDGITCTIKYKARHDAEQAASQGASFKGRNLIIVWSSSLSKPNIQTTTAPSPVPAVNPIHSPAALLASAKSKEDEDDDDDEEEGISVVVEPVVAYTPPQDDFGYGILEEELDEEALLTGADVDDEEETNLDEERSWRH